MAKSKKTTQKTLEQKPAEQPVEKAAVTDGSQSGKKRRPTAGGRRIPVHYTPRIPTAHCPWC